MTGKPPLSTGPAATVQPWLAPPARAVDRPALSAWRRWLDDRHGRAAREAHEALAPLGDQPELAVGVSVVVVAHESGPAALDRCLRSLARQNASRDLFEVIVVVSGHPSGVDAPVDTLRQVSIPVRIVRLDAHGDGQPYQAGTAAATREYLTIVDGRDTVAPSFVEVMLAHAGPRVASVAHVVEPGPDNGEGHTPVASEPTGSPVRLGDLGAAAAMPEAKLFAARLARAVPRRPGRIDEDALGYWARLAVDQHVTFQLCPATAAYYRSARPEPTPPPPTLERAIGHLDLIAELERLAAAADPGSRELLHRRIEWLTERVGDHLRQHPADHGAVVAALDRRPIFRLPYRRLNRGLDRGLVIAYAFPPYADTSGTVMAKRIRARGAVADVVYNAMDRIRKQDSTIRRISGPYTCDEAVIATPTHFSHWPSMEKFTLEGMRQIRDWTAAKGAYAWLYSRAHFAASHILAAAYKLSHPAVAWTAEFSDPLSRGRMGEQLGTPVTDGTVATQLRTGLRELGLPEPQSTNCFVWCEEIAYALADELIFTNENQLEYMLGYCSDSGLAEIARKKAVVSPHPTLPQEFYSMVDPGYPLEPGMVHLAYFGVFYATRGLDDVLTAVAACDPPTRERVRVHVFTTKPGPLRERATELGIGSLVRVGGYVDYLAFLNLTTRFDCLVVNDATTGDYHARNPYLPSKWSDYRGSGTPVWGLVEADSPLSRQPLTYRSPVGDIAAAEQVLSRIVRGKATEQPPPPSAG